MHIFQYVLLALAAVLVSLVLKQVNRELALILVLVTGIGIVVALLGHIAQIVRLVEDIARRADVGNLHLGTLLRVMGVAYVAEYGAQICKDAGEGSLSVKVELAGKLVILGLSIPLILVILDTILRLIP
ncbi:MAG: stage III sporulation protein AD [Selenomonadales bacterium]|nr:stage III sporulation protein AD [Selenomonadales bacterium]